MINAASALAVLVSLALAAPGTSSSWDARNAARARAGLLPRKPPARSASRAAFAPVTAVTARAETVALSDATPMRADEPARTATAIGEVRPGHAEREAPVAAVALAPAAPAALRVASAEAPRTAPSPEPAAAPAAARPPASLVDVLLAAARAQAPAGSHRRPDLALEELRVAADGLRASTSLVVRAGEVTLSLDRAAPAAPRPGDVAPVLVAVAARAAEAAPPARVPTAPAAAPQAAAVAVPMPAAPPPAPPPAIAAPAAAAPAPAAAAPASAPALPAAAALAPAPAAGATASTAAAAPAPAPAAAPAQAPAVASTVAAATPAPAAAAAAAPAAAPAPAVVPRVSLAARPPAPAVALQSAAPASFAVPPSAELIAQRTTQVGDVVQRWVESDGRLGERRIDRNGRLVTEQETGAVSDLAVLSRQRVQDGRFVEVVRDVSGALLEVSRDPVGRLLGVRILQRRGLAN